jgi:hypothetical protein
MSNAPKPARSGPFAAILSSVTFGLPPASRVVQGVIGAALLTSACHGDGAADDARACSIEASSELSTAVPSVGIVTWSSTHAGLDSARIEFGRDTDYGTTAPVDLGASEHRTLLLGMTTDTRYHFRVVASSSATNETCVSRDHELTTGPGPNGLALPTVATHSAGEVAPGFLLLSALTLGGPGGGPGGGRVQNGEGGDAGAFESATPMGGGGAPGGMVSARGGAPGGMSGPPDDEPRESVIYIVNQAAELVWWKTVPIGEVTRVALSYDGRYLVALSLNVNGSPNGRAVKVSMDGLDVEPWSVPNAHHDFTLTPDGGAVFIQKSADGCDELSKRSADGSFSSVFRVMDAFGGELAASGPGGELCHTNSIHYQPEDDSFTFSVLNQNAYVKVSSHGELAWLLGGSHSEFSGGGAEWQREHGHQMLGLDHLLFFNNGEAGESSLALEVALHADERTAARVWSYDGGLTSAVLGDVRRLPNGNTLVAYSTAGVIHQVNAAGALVQTLTWPLGGAFGYVEHRATLYGPPEP